ncbi:glucose-6-phosphate isomerase [Perilla frutescens var. hirtella]|uniref:Glucose-6-phosphate isomerase n=1 Tax=Perilla frutescens var. hirtella TaxID=608512 RepID=A0AAD4JMK9_PERFH|nr:glucose-6-phosphate isomerase [Perilla frutescens var. hirtella]KAH6810498.1 glucose-6-phosphate isomerase [Perilla frutescens var. frutescens]KAH6836615.1 glucose-6-phosphate isomerase [Perilla frutescens var. hirtella]
MASKVSNFSDLIQRVTASCLLHPLAGVSRPEDFSGAEDEDDYNNAAAAAEEEEFDFDEEEEFKINSGGELPAPPPPRIMELEMLMGQVFDAVSVMKRAYVSLQEAHCPWDPDKMRIADVAVVAEMRRLGLLRERFRRSVGGRGRGGRWGVGAATLREVVAPYEAAVDELKKEVKLKQVEIENLKEKLKTATSFDRVSGKSKGKSKRRVSCTTQVAAAPALEVFESTMSLVKEASKAFTSLLLSLMRSAHWDIAAAVRSIEAASSTTATMNNPTTTTTFTDSISGANHAKYALESYVNRKIFQGFDHETFYMDGSLSSILHPDQHRRDCFTQYRDMKAMDPVELLSILPTCSFGNFCFKKYLSIVHPKMEESLFGDLEQRRQVLDGHHPRSQFYGEFLGLAKAVWLLHLLAFSLDPPPSHFEASRGAEFHSQYMESVVRISGSNGGAKVGMSMVVGFPVSPGFKLGNGSIIKARVYLIPKN